MSRWISCIAILVLVRARHAVSQASADDIELETGTPQYIYMQSLHSKLREIEERPRAPLGDATESHTGGTLLATSIQSERVSGTGVTETGFDFAQGHILNFFFTVPRQENANTVHKAELWVFPHVQSAEPGNVIDLEIFLTARFSHARNRRHLNVKYSWRTEEGCIPLDVTTLARKISNSLASKELDETNVTVKLEVVKATTREARPGEGGCGDLLPLCNELQTRTNNNPFMIMKYYDESETTDNGVTTDGTLLGKRQVPNMNTSGKQESNCTLTSLVVSLKEVYGTFLVAPLMADIKNCQGGCTFNHYQSFSSHALVKDRLNFLSGGEHTQGLSVSCVPTELAPLELLIYKSGYFIIVEFPDMVAKKCSCR